MTIPKPFWMDHLATLSCLGHIVMTLYTEKKTL